MMQLPYCVYIYIGIDLGIAIKQHARSLPFSDGTLHLTLLDYQSA